MKGEKGQSILIIAGAIVAFLALFALVIDVGNYYAQQRIVKNAAEAAAIAGAQKLTGTNVTNQDVLLAVRRYIEENGLSWQRDNIKAYYTDSAGTCLQVDGNGNCASLIPADNNPPPEEAQGVYVEADKTFGTYFAQLVGYNQLRAIADSKAVIVCGSCSASGLFPMAVNDSIFDPDGGEPVMGKTYIVWDTGDPEAPGNFGWIRWRNQPPSSSVLIANMQDTSRSGKWSVGEWVDAVPGVKWAQGVRDELEELIDSGQSVTLIVYDAVRCRNGQPSCGGEQIQYRIAGFARFKIEAFYHTKPGQSYPPDYDFSGFKQGDKVIIGRFERWAQPSDLAGCVSYGVCAVMAGQGPPPPVNPKNIVGSVVINEVKLNQFTTPCVEHMPVDVVLVLDTSGSMNGTWGSEKKITTAKRVLQEFVDYLQPDAGDRVALVRFPKWIGKSRYDHDCGGYYRDDKYAGEIKVDLTSNLGLVKNTIQSLSVGGYTPLAGGLSKANEVLANSPNKGTNVPVIIVASDGMANVRIDGRKTGWGGGYCVPSCDPPSCNDGAILDAVAQANEAKKPADEGGLGAFVFSIGIGFYHESLETIATQPTDPDKQYFYYAPTPEELEQIYNTIGQRVQDICNETCQVQQVPAPGAGATVVLYRDGQPYMTTTASEGGAFQFSGVEPGVYQIKAWLEKDGLQYDILTDGVGGVQLSELPTIEISDAPGYEVVNVNLYLKNSTPVRCE